MNDDSTAKAFSVLCPEPLGRIYIKTTLAYYDGPVLFIGQDASGQDYLAMFIDEHDPAESFWVLVEVSDHRADQVLHRHIDLRTAFGEPETGELVIAKQTIRRVPPDDLEEDILPSPGLFA